MRDELLTLWPTPGEVDACVKREAESIDEAVFLAVHQPMHFLRRDVGAGGATVPQDEQNLLAEFLTDHLPEGNLILPVVGASGVGKSHVVRWLDAQIRRTPDAHRRHVIRVPKGSSLRGVLRLLLKDLEGEAFDSLRAKLEEARGHLDPDMAARQLQVHLRHRLERVSATAADRIQKGEAQPFDKERREYGSARFLPALLGEPELEQRHWLTKPGGGPGVLALLAEQVTHTGSAEDDQRRHVFLVEDLVLGEDIGRDRLSDQSRRAYQALDRDSSERREAAVRLLNEVLDDAKHDLLQLGDNTLTEQFAEVRAELHRSGRELVFLVEDFVVLSGLQGALLQVMIAEAVRDGVQQLCTMRTAIAYTEGTMAGRDTVLTRARREWLIEDRLGDESEILGRAERMVGAYLNAARVGKEGLNRAFSATGTLGSKDWVPTVDDAELEPETRKIVGAFGRSADGFLLFPFNHQAIEQLARRGCQDVNRRLVFNPRLVINAVLTPTLLARSAFEDDRFPPAHLGADELLSHEVSGQVGRRIDRAMVARYLCLFRLWGGQPATGAEAARLERAIYEAFGMAPLDFGVEPAPLSKTMGPEILDQTVSPPPTVEKTEEERWRHILEEWASGTTLAQKEAAQLRAFITDALDAFIPFDALLLKPRRKLRGMIKKVYLPRSEGQAQLEPKAALVVVATDEILDDPVERAALVATLMALVRRYCIHNTWAYDEGERDGGLVRDLLERLAPAAVSFLRSHHFQIEADAVPALVGTLLVGARAIGQPGVHNRAKREALIDGLLASGTLPSQLATSLWAEIQKRLHEGRPTWRSLLLEHVGARQGGAAAVYAIDAARLLASIDDTRNTWKLPGAPPSSRDDTQYYGFVQELNGLRVAMEKALREEQSTLTTWSERATSWFGEGFDKTAVQQNLRNIITEVKRVGLQPRADFERLRRQFAELPRWRLKEGLEVAARLAADPPRGEVLSLLAPGYGPTVEASLTLMKEMDHFLSGCEQALAGKEAAAGMNVVGEVMVEIGNTLDAIGTLLDQCEEARL